MIGHFEPDPFGSKALMERCAQLESLLQASVASTVKAVRCYNELSDLFETTLAALAPSDNDLAKTIVQVSN